MKRPLLILRTDRRGILKSGLASVAAALFAGRTARRRVSVRRGWLLRDTDS